MVENYRPISDQNAYQRRYKEPAQEVLYSRKKKTQNHPDISVNNIQVERVSYQKHLGIIVDKKFNFKEHIDSPILKVNRGIAVLKKLRYSLPRKSLIAIYQALLIPLLDYGDIIYDQPHHESVCDLSLYNTKSHKQSQVLCKVLLAKKSIKN